MLGVRQPGYNPSCAASQYDQGRLFSVSSLEKDLKKKKKINSTFTIHDLDSSHPTGLI